MNIELRRYRIKPDTIDEQLFIDGSKVCDCAENAHHCLPPGEYRVIIHRCHQHARKIPVIQLMNNSWAIHGNSCLKEKPCDSCPKLNYVSNNTTLPVYCPQIKPGNGVYTRTDGSIIVGRYLAPGCLTHPKTAFDSVFDRLRKSAERGHQITLSIINTH